MEDEQVKADVVAMLKQCEPVTKGKHRDGLAAVTLVADADTIASLCAVVVSLKRDSNIESWRERRVIDLLLANNREVERRRNAEAWCDRLKKAARAALDYLIYEEGLPTEIERGLRSAIQNKPEGVPPCA